ncbi:hypothetical protein Tco_0394271 [Tanacetum coccineum]
MEDEFYNLVVKGNDLKTYIRRFQELVILCPNMVPNAEKLIEVFINGLPRSIEGNVTASKPQTLEEAINIAQRLMDQIIKHDSVQEANDRKRKLEDKGNIINNNYQNNYNNNNRNNDHHQQQNGKQETFRTYTATNGYTGNRPLCERCTLHHIDPKKSQDQKGRKRNQEKKLGSRYSRRTKLKVPILTRFQAISSNPGFDSNEEEVVPKVDGVSLVDGVFDGAFGGDGEEDFVMGEGVVVSSSSLVRSTKSCLGGIMVSLIFLERLEEEACVDAMKVEEK